MVQPKNPDVTRETREGRHAAWKTLKRDSRGRWQKKSALSGTTKFAPTTASKSLIKEIDTKLAISTEKEAQSVLNAVQTEFNLTCPRCAGDMVKKNIRCGPERLVMVNKCTICNFFLPLNPATI